MLTLLIDGNHLAHRCKHVFSLSHKGVDVSVTYGFIRNIESLIRKFKPTSIIVCWDGGVPDFRCKAVESYKANRNHGDEIDYQNFLRQVQELSDYVLPMMGVLSVRRLRAEADDLLYHASRLLEGDIIIVTGDKDLLQCISERVKVYSPLKEILYDRKKVELEFDIDFKNYLDWRAIIGDSSDNIPGVMGIGAKTASKLFREFGTLTNITNAALGFYPDKVKAATIPQHLRNNIVAFGFDRIAKNIFITALYVDRTGSREAIVKAVSGWKQADPKRLKNYFMRNAFSSLMETLPANLARLSKPTLLDLTDIRVPRVCVQRHPVLH